MVAMFSTGDVGGVGAVVHSAYVDHQGLGLGPMYGPSGFTTVVAAARSEYETLDVTVEDRVEQGDRAAVRLRWRGTRQSGESVDRETLELLRLREGLAIEHWGGRS